MSSRDEEPRSRGVSTKHPVLHEKVAHFYYSHGLFCSTYPTTVICIAIASVLCCCYPLWHVSLFTLRPLQLVNSLPNVTAGGPESDIPFCYVQQVVLRTSVIPWEPHLTLGDAFRAPLYESFKLLDIVRNYEEPKTLKTLAHLCLHVESVKRNEKYKILPQYSCLVLSPANLWQQDVHQFAQDKTLLSTIFTHQNLQKGKTSLAEMVFGMQLKDTGIKRYPLRTRQRVLQYAITIFFKEYDKEFIEGLTHKLQTIYPLHQKNITQNNTIFIYYPEDLNYFELIPLITSFIILFLYYYFSVRKIEFIRSKIGMAFTAVMTVLCSLTMTLGICFFFGLNFSIQGREIFPYVVILIGLENVLILTKSVLSTQSHLDAKIRIAQGLSREGWSITQNLLLEITILTTGLFTFVPAIQEFCIFAIVALITDFYLQMLFFSTVLGIDIRRMENQFEKTNPNFRNNLYQSYAYYNAINVSKAGMNRSKSHPRLSSFHTDIVASQAQVQEKKIPKRVRLVNMWARTRFFQRAFMILMVAWIVMIVYKSGIIRNFFINNSAQSRTQGDMNYSSINLLPLPKPNDSYVQVSYVTRSPVDAENYSDEVKKLRHTDYQPWMELSKQHWSSILRIYNVSLAGKYVAILPSIRISHVVTPEQAVILRNSEERYNDKFQWQALAAALDPIDFSDLEAKNDPKRERPLYPTSPMEIFLTTILCVISIIVLTYVFVVLYRCICTRNYAEWRASWTNEKQDDSGSEIPVLLEVLPTILSGHNQEIECIASDGFSIASCCLSGQLKVWDCITGELLAVIDRKSHEGTTKRKRNPSADFEDNISDYESGSPPSRDEFSFPKLHQRINTNFSNLRLGDSPRNVKHDFIKQFEKLYVTRRSKSNCFDCDNTLEMCKKCDSRNRMNAKRFVKCNEGAGEKGEGVEVSQVWCMDYSDNLIAVGCSDGQIEFWEGTTGKLRCVFDDDNGIGITSIKIVGSRVIAVHLHGTLDFLQLQTYSQGKPVDWNFTCAYRRTHVRTGSAGAITNHRDLSQTTHEEQLQCIKVLTTRAHQQQITCMESDGGRVLTGSQDHTLKVFRLDDGSPLYTLHGHYGPITCLFIDRVCPATSGSGSQDGMLCVWDLMTGACMYSLQAHDGSITSLTYSASYVISLGADERLCIWERFQGHLLNTIQLSYTFSNQMVMLTPHLIVTARSGVLVVFDVRTGDNVKTVALGHCPFVFVKHLIMLRDAILCDYGNQLRLVRFPLIAHKYD